MSILGCEWMSTRADLHCSILAQVSNADRHQCKLAQKTGRQKAEIREQRFFSVMECRYLIVQFEHHVDCWDRQKGMGRARYRRKKHTKIRCGCEESASTDPKSHGQWNIFTRVSNNARPNKARESEAKEKKWMGKASIRDVRLERQCQSPWF